MSGSYLYLKIFSGYAIKEISLVYRAQDRMLLVTHCFFYTVELVTVKGEVDRGERESIPNTPILVLFFLFLHLLLVPSSRVKA